MHFRQLVFVVILVTVFAVWGGPVLALGKRVALVIGNSAYAHVSTLPNPANDAADIADALERIGFEVTRGLNLDFRGVRLAIRDFSKTADGADVAFVYFAGHGVEIDNTNYLIPIDARLEDDRDIEFEAVRLDSIVGSLSNVAGLKIVLVDACRNNPFLAQMTRSSATRSIGRGLARIDPGGVLVGYAAREGTLALDGEGRNSPYAQALLTHIEEPGLELGRMFRKIRSTVLNLTDGYQEPFTYGSLPDQDIYLVPAVALPPAPAPAGSLVARLTMPPDVEERLSAAYARAEQRNTVIRWQSLVDQWSDYPDHPLLRIAQRKLEELQAETEAAKRRAEARKPWITPRKGSDGSLEFTREERQLIQKALLYLGMDVGAIDGSFGPQTRNAIAAARVKLALPPGVSIDELMLERLPDPVRIDALKTRTARAYTVEEVEDINEPRLELVVEKLQGRPIVFNYFDGRLYVVPAELAVYHYATLTARSWGGHLVTLNSAEENRFVASLFVEDKRFLKSDNSGNIEGPMIGLIQADQSQEPGGGWIWATGEPVNYRNWQSWSPDNWKEMEHNARFSLKRGQSPSNLSAWRWDDGTNQNSGGYIVEIE